MSAIQEALLYYCASRRLLSGMSVAARSPFAGHVSLFGVSFTIVVTVVFCRDSIIHFDESRVNANIRWKQ
jgi:hypothetical protein